MPVSVDKPHGCQSEALAWLLSTKPSSKLSSRDFLGLHGSVGLGLPGRGQALALAASSAAGVRAGTRPRAAGGQTRTMVNVLSSLCSAPRGAPFPIIIERSDAAQALSIAVARNMFMSWRIGGFWPSLQHSSSCEPREARWPQLSCHFSSGVVQGEPGVSG